MSFSLCKWEKCGLYSLCNMKQEPLTKVTRSTLTLTWNWGNKPKITKINHDLWILLLSLLFIFSLWLILEGPTFDIWLRDSFLLMNSETLLFCIVAQRVTKKIWKSLYLIPLSLMVTSNEDHTEERSKRELERQNKRKFTLSSPKQNVYNDLLIWLYLFPDTKRVFLSVCRDLCANGSARNLLLS